MTRVLNNLRGVEIFIVEESDTNGENGKMILIPL